MTGHIDKSPADIANGLRKIASDMMESATDIRHYLGEDDSIKALANQLIGSAMVLSGEATKLETGRI